jgi:hypothetical protein
MAALVDRKSNNAKNEDFEWDNRRYESVAGDNNGAPVSWMDKAIGMGLMLFGTSSLVLAISFMAWKMFFG